MNGEKQLFFCIFLLYPGLVLFERNLSAKKITQNWYDKASSVAIKNVCTSSTFLHLDLFLKKNSKHMKGPQAPGCDKMLLTEHLLACNFSKEQCMLRESWREESTQLSSSENPGQHDSIWFLQNFSNYPISFPCTHLSEPSWSISLCITLQREICFCTLLFLYSWFSQMPHCDSAHEWQVKQSLVTQPG